MLLPSAVEDCALVHRINLQTFPTTHSCLAGSLEVEISIRVRVFIGTELITVPPAPGLADRVSGGVKWANGDDRSFSYTEGSSKAELAGKFVTGEDGVLKDVQCALMVISC